MAFPRTSSKALRAGRTAESRITNSDGKINETILKVKFFVFLRHSSLLDRYSITITQAT